MPSAWCSARLTLRALVAQAVGGAAASGAPRPLPQCGLPAAQPCPASPSGQTLHPPTPVRPRQPPPPRGPAPPCPGCTRFGPRRQSLGPHLQPASAVAASHGAALSHRTGGQACRMAAQSASYQSSREQQGRCTCCIRLCHEFCCQGACVRVFMVRLHMSEAGESRSYTEPLSSVLS